MTRINKTPEWVKNDQDMDADNDGIANKFDLNDLDDGIGSETKSPDGDGDGKPWNIDPDDQVSDIDPNGDGKTTDEERKKVKGFKPRNEKS